jgi:hypothetical protein
MLYLNIITWEPPQREAVMKRFASQGAKLPAGMKMLGLWADICGGRVFELVDTGDVRDPKVSVQANHEWTDLCKIESVGVMNAEEMMKVVSGKK